MVVRSQFDQEYEQLENRMLDLKMTALEEMKIFQKSLVKNKSSYMQDMKNLHAQAAGLCRECLHQCRQIILLQQPVASDMRRMHSISNAFSDLERITDMEMQAFELLIPFDNPKEKEGLQPSIDIAKTMLANALNNFATEFCPVRSVIQMDDQADAEYERQLSEKTEKLRTNPELAEVLVNVLMAAKYMERICDHCVSIARWSGYSLK